MSTIPDNGQEFTVDHYEEYNPKVMLWDVRGLFRFRFTIRKIKEEDYELYRFYQR